MKEKETTVTDTQQAPETEPEEVTEPAPVEDNSILDLDKLDFYQLNNGMNFFFANHKGSTHNIEGNGFNFYYILAYAKEKVVEKSVTTTKFVPKIFKVVDTLVSRVVVEADPDEVPLEEIEAGARFKLPRFPLSLRQRLDDFFRTVADMYGTESIVLLTFDTTKTGSDGWGVLIPPQSNTAGHCKYDAEAIASEKPDHVYIVGSVHSHPDMAAYASGTDHEDQADFDGVHITYGWQKHKGNITEYHGELQMLGVSYNLNIDNFFEEEPPRVVDAEVTEWTKKVTKDTPPPVSHGTGSRSGPIISSGKAQPSPHSTTGTTPSTTGAGESKDDSWKKTLPTSMPSLYANHIIFELPKDKANPSCAFCKCLLVPHELNMRKCTYCNHYFVNEGETLEDILDHRNKNNYVTPDIDIYGEKKVAKAIYIWRIEKDAQGGHHNTFSMVYNPNEGNETGGGQGKA